MPPTRPPETITDDPRCPFCEDEGLPPKANRCRLHSWAYSGYYYKWKSGIER